MPAGAFITVLVREEDQRPVLAVVAACRRHQPQILERLKAIAITDIGWAKPEEVAQVAAFYLENLPELHRDPFVIEDVTAVA